MADLGVLKAILCFKHGAIPPQPFSGALAGPLESPEAQFFLPSQYTPLPRPLSSRLQLIGVSSFGLSGTLVHIILQEPPTAIARGPEQPSSTRAQIFVLSAASGEELRARAQRYLCAFGERHLRRDKLQSICSASRLTRDHHSFRRAMLVRNWRELLDGLQAAAIAYVPRGPQEVVMVGLWFGMLVDGSGAARVPVNAGGHRLYQTELARIAWQPQYSFFAAQLALARTLTQLGVTAHAVGGEGMGELVAGVVAGAITPSAVFCEVEDATYDAASAIARCPPDVLHRYLATCTADEAKIIGQDGLETFRLIGTRTALSDLALVSELHLTVLDNEALPRPCRVDEGAAFSAPCMPIASATFGGLLHDAAATSAAYWARVQQGVFSGDGGFVALAEHCSVVVNLAAQVDPHSCGHNVVAGECLEQLLCKLYEARCDIDWEMFHGAMWPVERLPTYTWSASKDV
jgi:hypothetical protein